MGTAAKPARPEWTHRLERLREQLGFSQAALAKRLNVSPMAPSRWERGINEPPAEIYIQLGKLAGEPGCWYFWEQAGLKKNALVPLLPKLQGNRESLDVSFTGASKGAKASPQVALPLYETSPSIGTAGHPAIHRNEVERIVAPRAWCPHPGKTICLRMGGEKMNPILRQGYIFAVDEADHFAVKLQGKMVLARHPQEGFLVSWLQRYGSSDILVPENQDYVPSYMHKNDWTIVGKVLWWIAKAP